MMKKYISVLCIFVMILTCVGCSKKANQPNTNESKQEESVLENANNDTTEESDNLDTEKEKDNVVPRVASLKGATSLGLLQMMNNAKESGQYQFEMFVAADEIVTKVVKGEVDIALLPANAAAVLYQKTNQQIQVIDINTLGVLYVVEHSDKIQSFQDLKGMTICMTGKGIVPEYALSYLLSKNGLSMDDVTVEFKSEPAEVVAYLSKTKNAVGILPQPFATVATEQDDTLRIALDFTEEWNKVDSESSLITGVTIVRKEFLNEHEEAVKQFLEDHDASVKATNSNVEEAAALAESFDIVKAAVAKKAIPFCNVVCITGDEMQKKLSGYLSTLVEANAESTGGSLPDEGFYYKGSVQK